MEFCHSGNSCFPLDLGWFKCSLFFKCWLTARDKEWAWNMRHWCSLTWCCCLCTNKGKGLGAYRLCRQGFKDCSWHKSRGVKLSSQYLEWQRQSSCSSAGREYLGRYASELQRSWYPARSDEKPPRVHVCSGFCIPNTALPAWGRAEIRIIALLAWRRAGRCPGIAKGPSAPAAQRTAGNIAGAWGSPLNYEGAEKHSPGSCLQTSIFQGR